MKKFGFAKIKFLRIAPTKIKKILDKIQGVTYSKALKLLYTIPQKAGTAIFKALVSAASNASHNNGIEKKQLFVKQAYVNQGSILKRVQARAKGRSAKIEKKMCHLTIYLEQTKL